MDELTRITIDFETRSACELKKAGAYKYSLDPSTQPTCMAFKIRNGAVQLLPFKTINTPWSKFPVEGQRIWQSFIDAKYLFVAHNAFFEQCIYNNIMVKRYGWPKIPPRLWRCTAAKAAACALPRSLEGAGQALELTTQKDKRGFVAMMLTCKPTKTWNAWDKNQIGDAPPKFLEPEANPQVWEILYTYCKIDVQTEELLDITLPDLIPDEQELWFLNQRLNWRGLRVDVPIVKKIVDIMAIESKTKLKELDTITMGLVTKAGARQTILDFLKLEGIELPDIKAKTIDDILKGGKLNPDMRRLLEIRKALSKTSTKKYQSFIDRAGHDNRVRDILLYHGASTGRDTGTGVQPHNFPRGAIAINKDRPYTTVENVKKCDYEMLKLLYGDSLSIIFSSILRNMIIPSENHELFVADFSKIEVAVLWWLAENKEGLEILRSGKDPYIYQAAKNIGKTYEEIELACNRGEKWAEDARQLGKAQILGCGFGMGWKKFQTTAYEQYRLKLTDEQSQKAVNSYRELNATVGKTWVNYERAAVMAIEEHKMVTIGKCIFSYSKGFLWIQLPSGRKLAYRKPRIVFEHLEWGTHKRLEFLGLAPNKKDLRIERTWGGKLTENIVQAVARDLMMPAMLRLEKKGYTPLLMVHDEAITERKTGEGNLDEFKTIMCEYPKWADEHLPIDAKAWCGMRYKK